MKILLSPAKNIDIGKVVQSKLCTSPVFLKDAEVLMQKMRKFSASKIGKMMSLSRDLSELNYNRNQNWKSETNLNGENAHAIAAFNGEVYRGLDATSMKESQIMRTQEQIRILSGLYGVLRPLDVIYPYRLEMGTKWAITPTKKNLYAYWGKRIAEQLNAEESEVIINLASSEYFKAADVKKLKARIITPVFKEFKEGKYVMLMVYAKKARGMMARYAIDNQITDPDQLKLFDTDGYCYDVNQSSDNEWVFTR